MPSVAWALIGFAVGWATGASVVFWLFRVRRVVTGSVAGCPREWTKPIARDLGPAELALRNRICERQEKRPQATWDQCAIDVLIEETAMLTGFTVHGTQDGGKK